MYPIQLHRIRLILFCLACWFNGGLTGTTDAGKPVGNLASYAQSRTWTDEAGRFTLTASLVEADALNVQLSREDGKVVEVPVDKLCKDDREFIQKFLAAEEKENRKATTRGTFQPTKIVEFKQSRSSSIELSLFREFWHASEVKPMRLESGLDMAMEISIPRGDGYQLFVSGARPNVFLNVWKQSNWPGESSYSVMGGVRFPDGAPSILAESQTPWRLLAATPDAKRFAVAYKGERSHVYIGIWDKTVDDVRPRFQFQLGHGGKRGAFVASNSEVRVATFVTPDQLVTLTDFGDVSLWNLKSKSVTPIANLNGAKDLDVGGNGELIAVAAQGKILVFDGDGKRQIGMIRIDSMAEPSIAFSPNGKYLAAYTPYCVHIIKLVDGKIQTTIPVPMDGERLSIAWVGDYPLLDHQLLLDIERGIPVWKYEAPDQPPIDMNDSVMSLNGRTNSLPWINRFQMFDGTDRQRQAAWGGQLFTLFRMGKGSIVATSVPHEEAIAAMASIDVAKMDALPEGTELTIIDAMTGLAADEKSAVIESIHGLIRRRGWSVSREASNSVTLAVEQSPPREMMMTIASSGAVEKVLYRPSLYTLRFDVAGKKVFTLGEQRHVRGWPRANEPAQQFVDRVTQPSPDFFLNVQLPNRILWPEYQWGLGTSRIEPSGNLESNMPSLGIAKPETAPTRRPRK